jgi:glutamate-5-semialdehyde dehydrogenase
MKMKNPLEPAGRTALEASRELLALEPEEKALALRLMAAGVRSAAEKIVRENGLDMEEARKGGRNAAFLDRLLLTHGPRHGTGGGSP